MPTVSVPTVFIGLDSVALHYAHYNFVRVHRTLRCTPAMAAGVTDRLWSVGELIEQAQRSKWI